MLCLPPWGMDVTQEFGTRARDGRGHGADTGECGIPLRGRREEGIHTLTISHFKEAPLPKNNTLAKWGPLSECIIFWQKGFLKVRYC